MDENGRQIRSYSYIHQPTSSYQVSSNRTFQCGAMKVSGNLAIAQMPRLRPMSDFSAARCARKRFNSLMPGSELHRLIAEQAVSSSDKTEEEGNEENGMPKFSHTASAISARRRSLSPLTVSLIANYRGIDQISSPLTAGILPTDRIWTRRATLQGRYRRSIYHSQIRRKSMLCSVPGEEEKADAESAVDVTAPTIVEPKAKPPSVKTTVEAKRREDMDKSFRFSFTPETTPSSSTELPSLSAASSPRTRTQSSICPQTHWSCIRGWARAVPACWSPTPTPYPTRRGINCRHIVPTYVMRAVIASLTPYIVIFSQARSFSSVRTAC